ncbi:hypothetical protein [Hansschlegelia beijingensis]|uniref:DUF2163 domain-containing protein n=1 Tax=Hansschlegelia beijingensis TaxID=1133344 RepID=A0A7W6CX95_9HYPH|nr:hypothetical protein [Hansschlegelia beijingensis]MBB3972786.1 hypothetical protein [Hansschlegelia beijingensis]
MTPWSAEEEAAFASGSIGYGIFFHLRTDPPVRLWAGIGDCEGEINAIDQTSEIYRGAGTLTDIPAVQSMINGKSERIAFRLSGVDDRVLELARGERAAIKGKTVHLGFGVFRRDWSSLLGPVRWVWRGRADYMEEVIGEADDISAPLRRSVQLSVGSMLTSRKRPQFSFYTDKDQQSRSPGDRFCERTPNYVQEYAKIFGPT